MASMGVLVGVAEFSEKVGLFAVIAGSTVLYVAMKFLVRRAVWAG
jgi:hypothetical protein